MAIDNVSKTWHRNFARQPGVREAMYACASWTSSALGYATGF